MIHPDPEVAEWCPLFELRRAVFGLGAAGAVVTLRPIVLDPIDETIAPIYRDGALFADIPGGMRLVWSDDVSPLNLAAVDLLRTVAP